MHVNDVGTDTIQEVLGMGDEDQDALKTAKPENQSGILANEFHYYFALMS